MRGSSASPRTGLAGLCGLILALSGLWCSCRLFWPYECCTVKAAPVQNACTLACQTSAASENELEHGLRLAVWAHSHCLIHALDTLCTSPAQCLAPSPLAATHSLTAHTGAAPPPGQGCTCVNRLVTACVCQAGDALLIPEGWWHQVDSDPATLAVNFWWASKPGCPLLPSPYQLRRTLQVQPWCALAGPAPCC